MVTRCHLCGGQTVHQRVTAESWWDGALALVEDVPAWVCAQCGEQYFDAETSRQLEKLRRAPPPARRVVEVSVYAFPGDVAS